MGKKILNTDKKQEIINKYLEVSQTYKKNLVHFKQVTIRNYYVSIVQIQNNLL